MTKDTLGYLKSLKANGVHTVRYFHCDHFEPWRRGVKEEHAAELNLFREQVSRNPFASKMTLFYKPHVPYSFNAKGMSDDVPHVSGEPIGFPGLTPEQTIIARDAMLPIVEQGHEIQLHVHHEGYTLSDVNHYPDLRTWLDEHGTAEADSKRLRVTLTEHLKQVQSDTGVALKDWFFVHGNWALNGSDPSICRIHDEIEILQSMGSIGDFTFPAGRRGVNPSMFFEPYTCRAVTGPKSYDTPASDPRPITDLASRGDDRFFIWYSDQLHPTMSLDVYSKSVQTRLEDQNVMLDGWLRNAPVYDGVIYVKTYAHSLNGRYFDTSDSPLIPHADPRVQSLFSQFETVIEKSGLSLELVTVSDVYRALMTGPAPQKLLVESEIKAVQVPSKSKLAGASVLEKFKKALLGRLPQKHSRDPMDIAPLDATAVKVMRQRIETMGVTDSGAYNFYKIRVDRDEMVTRHEREIVDAMFATDPDIARVVDIGSGLGNAALAVVAHGAEGVALEYDRRRVAATNEIFEQLRKDHPGPGHRLTSIQGAFPETMPERSDFPGLFVALTTNIMGTMPSQIEDKMIEGLTLFDVAYVDVQRFGNSRENEDEYAALLSRMADAGLKSQRLILDQGKAGVYYRLAKA